jgi:hypothetical protein
MNPHSLLRWEFITFLFLLFCGRYSAWWDHGLSFQLVNLVVGLLGRWISPPQGHYVHRTDNTNYRTDAVIHALSRFRIHDRSLWASEDSSCLRPRGHSDWQFDFLPSIDMSGFIFICTIYAFHRVRIPPPGSCLTCCGLMVRPSPPLPFPITLTCPLVLIGSVAPISCCRLQHGSVPYRTCVEHVVKSVLLSGPVCVLPVGFSLSLIDHQIDNLCRKNVWWEGMFLCSVTITAGISSC